MWCFVCVVVVRWCEDDLDHVIATGNGGRDHVAFLIFVIVVVAVIVVADSVAEEVACNGLALANTEIP